MAMRIDFSALRPCCCLRLVPSFGDGCRDVGGNASIKWVGQDAFGRWIANEVGQFMGGGDLHRFRNLVRPGVERSSKDAWECEEIIHLVWEVAAACTDDGRAAGASLIRHDLRNGLAMASTIARGAIVLMSSDVSKLPLLTPINASLPARTS